VCVARERESVRVSTNVRLVIVVAVVVAGQLPPLSRTTNSRDTHARVGDEKKEEENVPFLVTATAAYAQSTSLSLSPLHHVHSCRQGVTIENWVEDESAMYNVGKNLLGDQAQDMAAATTQRTDYNVAVRNAIMLPLTRPIILFFPA
jgi:hypothetical protein